MRQNIIDEAMSWLRTPWHHRACVKSAGVDCVFLIVGVYNAVGLTHISDADIPYYSRDIMMHRNEETVLGSIVKYGIEVTKPARGDVAIWKFGRIFSHAAIIVDWPIIIHAHRQEGMVLLGDASKGELVGREVKFFSLIKD